MAPPIQIAHWITITVAGNSQAQVQENVFSYRTTPDIPSPLQCLQVAQNWWAACGTAYLNLLSSEVVVNTITCTTHYPGPANYTAVYTLTPPPHGNQVVLPLPQNAASVISWRSGAVGRSFRGRTFGWGLPENVTDGATIVNSYLAQIAQLATLVATFAGGGGIATSLVIASRKLLLLIPVITAVIDLFIKNQRDRLPQERRRDRPGGN